MYNEICENCKYQRYKFLERYDTICPFMYDFSTCYAFTDGDESIIDAYRLLVDSQIKERIHINSNEQKSK